MARIDRETGEEIAHRVTTPHGTTVITLTNADFWKQTPGAEVEEVRGYHHPSGTGFVVTRTVN